MVRSRMLALLLSGVFSVESAPSGVPPTWLSPQYHINDGRIMRSDPSGTIEINGTWFLFPDVLWPDSEQAEKSMFTSSDLVHWTRRPTDLVFQETGGIGVTSDGYAVTFGGGFKWTNISKDPLLSAWQGCDGGGCIGAEDPHTAAWNGEKPPNGSVFRVGDPSRPFTFNGSWYMILGAGRNTPVVQGEARLVRATNANWTAWEFVSVMYASNHTEGRWAAQDTNMFECPDFFPIGDKGKWMFVTSKIFQGDWVTGGNHHWDEFAIGSFDGVKFVPDSTGVLDYGYVAAGKTGAGVTNTGRRVFFGWNMPWSRQGANGSEGPVTRSDAAPSFDEYVSLVDEPSGPMWPAMQPFGSQVLPRDLSLFPDGTLRLRPVPELVQLRRQSFHQHEIKESLACLPLPFNSTQLELKLSVQSASQSDLSSIEAWASIVVLGTADGSERTLIGANATHLIVDQRSSTLRPDLTPEELRKTTFYWNAAAVANRTVLYAPLQRSTTHRIHVFLDGHNCEIFADERVSITTNLFPTLPSSVCSGVVIGEAGAAISGLDVYRLAAAPVQGLPPTIEGLDIYV